MAAFAVLLAAPAARAQATGCAPPDLAWAVRASEDLKVHVELRSCSSAVWGVRLTPADRAPIDVEVAATPGPAFRHAGGVRLSLSRGVADLSRASPLQRAAVDGFALWLAWHQRELVSGDPPHAGTGPRAEDAQGRRPGAPWCLLAALALAALAFAGRDAPRAARRDVALAAALAASALALRLVLGAWGPFHVNGHGANWLAKAIADADVLADYGPGYAEVFHPVAALAPRAPDMAIFAANAALGALAPALAFALARALGLEARRAALAGGALALDPVGVRFAATEAYFPLLIALSAGCALAACAAASRWLAGDRRRAALLAGAAGMFAAQAVRTHPVAWLPTALAPLAAVAIAGDVGARTRVRLAAAALAGVGVLAAAPHPRLVLAALAHERDGTIFRPHAPGPLELAVVAALALLLAPAWFARARPQWIAVPAVASLGALLLTRGAYSQSALWAQAYDRLFLTLPLAGLVALVPAHLLRRGRAWGLVLAAALGAWGVWGLPLVRARTTDALEYAWLRPWFARLPPGCRVAYLASAWRRLAFLPWYLAPGHTRSTHIELAADGRDGHGLPMAQCVFYVHTSICTSAEGRPACEALEHGPHELVPVARTTLPAAPSHHQFPYDRPTVDVVISRVQ